MIPARNSIPKESVVSQVRIVFGFPSAKNQSVSPEISQAYKDELDIRLARMETEPHVGFAWEESIQILEKRFGKKIKA